MAESQQGFEYEKNATKVLKRIGLVPQGFTPAGARHDQPDLILEFRHIKAGCELKITATSAGGLVLKYDITNKRKPWGFNEINREDTEKLFIQNIAYDVGFIDLANKKWNKTPLKFVENVNFSNSEKYYHDKKTFQDISGSIPANNIEKYYNRKHTQYINIGTHGFYLLGNSNPFHLEKVPRFGSAAEAHYRARVQDKGSGNYQFIFEMNFHIPSNNKSPWNIAPVSGSSVEIIKNKIELGPLLLGVKT